MPENLSKNKTQIILIASIAAVVLAKNIIVMFNKGSPIASVMFFCIAMSILFVLFFFRVLSSKKEDFFKGETLFGAVSAVLIFLWSFSEYYITLDYCVATTALPIMIFCASDIRFMPLNAAIALVLSILNFDNAVFASAFPAVAVALVFASKQLNDAKSWKILVFAATQICLVVNGCYSVYRLRFNFSTQTARAYLATTVVMILLAVFAVVCAVVSLQSRKASPARKKKKAIEEIKADYFAALGYVVLAAFAVVSTMLELRAVMSGIVGILMAMYMICTDSSAARFITDKAANAVGKLFSGIFSKSDK